MSAMNNYPIEFDRETDGRWIAEIPSLPGAIVYGTSKEEAETKVRTLALGILASKSS